MKQKNVQKRKNYRFIKKCEFRGSNLCSLADEPVVLEKQWFLQWNSRRQNPPIQAPHGRCRLEFVNIVELHLNLIRTAPAFPRILAIFLRNPLNHQNHHHHNTRNWCALKNFLKTAHKISCNGSNGSSFFDFNVNRYTTMWPFRATRILALEIFDPELSKSAHFKILLALNW